MNRAGAVLIAFAAMSVVLGLFLLMGRRVPEPPLAAAVKSSVSAQGVKGSGKFVDQQFPGGAPSSIEVRGPFVVTVLADSSPLKVRIEDNLLPYLVVERKGSSVEVSWKGSVNPTEDVTVAVGAPRLEEVDLSGAAQLSAEGLSASRFRASASGASTMTLGGSVQELKADLDGASTLRGALSAPTTSVEIDADGASSVGLKAEGPRLKVDASGASQVEVTGEFVMAEVDADGASTVEAVATRSLTGSASGASTLITRSFPGLNVKTSGAATIRPKS